MDNKLTPIEINPEFESKIQQFTQAMNIPEQKNYMAYKAQQQIIDNLEKPVYDIPFKNPNEEMEELTVEQNEKLDKQTSELMYIHYENMKLNAQIEVLNKTIDSHDDDIVKLQNTISKLKSELETVHQIIKDNNKHYWIYTIITGLLVGLVLYIIEQFF